MSIAKTIEITSESTKSFDDAIEGGIERASKTVNDIKSAWVGDQEVAVKDGKVVGYKVRLKVTFVVS